MTNLLFIIDNHAGGMGLEEFTFFIGTMALMGASAFFFLSLSQFDKKWRNSILISGLITFIAAVHYYYMRAVWVETGETPTVLRYIDWLLTVPLQMVEFYLILAACTNVAGSLFKKLLVGSLVMLGAGFAGEAGLAPAMPAFIVGMAGWLYMIYELYMGEGKAAVSTASPAVNSAYNAMMMIIVVGWSIYPLGYVAGYLMGAVDASTLNLIYNLADFINKILFGLIIWHVAVKESSHSH